MSSKSENSFVIKHANSVYKHTRAIHDQSCRHETRIFAGTSNLNNAFIKFDQTINYKRSKGNFINKYHFRLLH